ncbi:hypothetical protein POPTR_005G092950v4 [Populus trichocarpa]|nr:hypothetical protein POPTR_005G092950v4 [Populus trichocarpa]
MVSLRRKRLGQQGAAGFCCELPMVARHGPVTKQLTVCCQSLPSLLMTRKDLCWEIMGFCFGILDKDIAFSW